MPASCSGEFISPSLSLARIFRGSELLAQPLSNAKLTFVGRFGNRWQQNGPHTMLLTFSGNNNRIDGYSYDSAGNLIGDGTHTYTYDAENRPIKVDGGNTSTVHLRRRGPPCQQNQLQ